MNAPELLIVAGPNGSGKTTFARRFAEAKGIRYLGADDIAAELDPENPLAVAVKAARVFSRRLEESLKNHETLVVESTLAGRSLQSHAEAARELGYRVGVLFIFLDSPELCLARITERVARGGHGVPEEDVRRRFARSLKNFWRIYRPLAAEWTIFYNGGDSFQQVASGVGDKITTVVDEKLLNLYLALLGGVR